MKDCHEYLARAQAILADPTKMMARMGISPSVPHEIEVMRLVKDEKKRSAQRPKSKASGSGTISPLCGLPWPRNRTKLPR